MEDDEVSPTLEDFVLVYQGNKSAITLGQFYLKCTHPARNLVPQVSLNLPDMAHGGLKVPNKVNSTIIKGFRNMELSFLDPVPETKLVKCELLASSVGGDVDLVGGSSCPTSLEERSTQTFSEEKSEKDILVGPDHLLGQVVASLGENFARRLLIEQGFSLQVASFGDERDKLRYR
ncbi:hypothetical protein LWI28_028319 [Acer negundo]|uniref:Uncharacterized protein n=1 Tax=Acer negundo TaxID=4023 RepID=A0AAD5JMI1_ACENE|nr:hypothetical protein LWI28_028319 [Acer negundo]